ncbi:2-keto-4-pentenoate hydratase/2-oxohepta-3-ene-1,7-dioic acid hydratase in catechol pathway [Pseudokineococcus lusitanus]|uniref:2-keto-4-pentenoate hydratase/2-oxohepta-3-ene-1,7-dioic acid hydratase in catechol pathway n=1 Tax=Pseudokineococcus lusitanus TaxID=763993 RepID=A0A3N1HMU6_9ACTN|nr:2-keto-4-pentenoate hydratase/2-oxohepta-3-ene-1,7-dioic acid hydratase in catechol pathway [Pseudokineococcus lusitanus]
MATLADVRIARFTRDDDISYGLVEGGPGEERLHVVAGDPLYAPLRPTGAVVGLDEVRLLAPVIPRSKVVGIGRNYRDHAAEMGNDVPTKPLMFLVPNTAVVGPDDPVVLPDFSEDVHYEGELAVVIGRICKDVPRERAAEVVYGYTCANDVTARDAQKGDGQWARAKGFDSSCPLGPWITTELDVDDLALRTRLDGRTVQDGRTSDMVFDVPDLVAAVSAAFTLLPGDVILTGTPAGVGPVTAGQRVEVDIEGIGVLSNPVVQR